MGFYKDAAPTALRPPSGGRQSGNACRTSLSLNRPHRSFASRSLQERQRTATLQDLQTTLEAASICIGSPLENRSQIPSHAAHSGGKCNIYLPQTVSLTRQSVMLGIGLHDLLGNSL